MEHLSPMKYRASKDFTLLEVPNHFATKHQSLNVWDFLQLQDISMAPNAYAREMTYWDLIGAAIVNREVASCLQAIGAV